MRRCNQPTRREVEEGAAAPSIRPAHGRAHALRDEISHLFSIYKQPEGKHVMVDGWFPREQALDEIERARERWADRRDQSTT
jgi:inorganic pyrophosphatase